MPLVRGVIKLTVSVIALSISPSCGTFSLNFSADSVTSWIEFRPKFTIASCRCTHRCTWAYLSTLLDNHEGEEDYTGTYYILKDAEEIHEKYENGSNFKVIEKELEQKVATREKVPSNLRHRPQSLTLYADLVARASRIMGRRHASKQLQHVSTQRPRYNCP